MAAGRFRFPGGIRPHHAKTATEARQIERCRLPAVVVIPLHQHTGAPCEPLVKAGDAVKVGQKVGDSKAAVSVPVHASVSGKVVAVEPRPHPSGVQLPAVVIESDGQGSLHEGVEPRSDPLSPGPEEIRQVIREAGIAGMGGAAFPTHIKVSPPPQKRIDSFVMNGAECEPYLTCDHRLMVERTGDAVLGMRLLMKALGVRRGYIAIEKNKPDALAAMRRAVKDEEISIVELPCRYPQGAEKQLIKTILNREVPSGGLPLDVGVVVNNVGTAAAVAAAVRDGMPLVERVVTVTGPGVREPRNLSVRIGTLFRDVIEECGGFNGRPRKVIMGGPMMGIAQGSLDVPVVKGTSGILVLPDGAEPEEQVLSCVRCARCVDTCPMLLLPMLLADLGERGRFTEAEENYALDCIECGCCAYVCPARRPLVQAIRLAKAEILARRRKTG